MQNDVVGSKVLSYPYSEVSYLNWSNTLWAGTLDDQVLIVALLIFIPVTVSYTHMLLKSRHEIEHSKVLIFDTLFFI